MNKPGCHHEFENFLTGKGRFVGFGCMVATGICLLNIITVCCICFHRSKSKRGNNFYAKMMDED